LLLELRGIELIFIENHILCNNYLVELGYPDPIDIRNIIPYKISNIPPRLYFISLFLFICLAIFNHRIYFVLIIVYTILVRSQINYNTRNKLRIILPKIVSKL
jgi:hypothetical protein